MWDPEVNACPTPKTVFVAQSPHVSCAKCFGIPQMPVTPNNAGRAQVRARTAWCALGPKQLQYNSQIPKMETVLIKTNSLWINPK